MLSQKPLYGPLAVFDETKGIYPMASAIPGVDAYGRTNTAIPGLMIGCEIESDGGNTLIFQPGVMAIGEPYHYHYTTSPIFINSNSNGENCCDKYYDNADGIYYAYARGDTNTPKNGLSLVLSQGRTISDMIANMGFLGKNAFRKMPFACRKKDGVILPFNIVGDRLNSYIIPVGFDYSSRYRSHADLQMPIMGNINFSHIVPDNCRVIDLHIRMTERASYAKAKIRTNGVLTDGIEITDNSVMTVTLDSGLNIRFQNTDCKVSLYVEKLYMMETV